MLLEVLARDAAPAVEAVRDAVRFVRRIEGDTSAGTLTKTDASPVTVVDFALQAFLVSRLAHIFPGDLIVAEEDATLLRPPEARSLRDGVVELVKQMMPNVELETEQVLAWIDQGSGACGRRFWTLDPIDGTKGLLRGGQYVVALALVMDGRVHVSALGCPRLTMTTGPASPSGPADSPARAVMVPLEENAEGGVAVAVRDRGAWWMSLRGGGLMRLSVSTETNPARARALHSYEPGHGDIAHVHRTLHGLGVHAPPILMDSQAKHVLLAAGAAELLLRFPADAVYHEAIWDQAAGSLLIEEAGGRVTDTEGRSLDFTTGRRLTRNTGLVASNGLLHEAVLDVIGQESSGGSERTDARRQR
jgi:3'(2'), 5'-bisphosphate nucleotidase